jgi:4-amino-4-deoxychorismate lyase
VRAGRPLNWRWHIARLRADCATLSLPPPAEELLREELARAAPGDATAKIILTRGSAGRGYAMPASVAVRRIVMSFPPPAYPAQLASDGVAVHRCRLVLAQQPQLAGAKTLNRLENVLARSEWSDAAIAEGLLGDAAGRVVEGTMSNLFVVKAGHVSTPVLSRCGVVGAQRERVRELLGARCGEGDISWHELDQADEAFLTNSLIGAWPIARLDRRRWAPGPVTREVQALLAQQDARA